MAEVKFACPRCAQHITCDELWCGHQIQCPNCQNELTVPAKPASAATPAAAAGNSLVPKVPKAQAPKLSIGQAHTQPAAAAQAQAPARAIPIRNLAPPPPKKQSAILKYVVITALLIGLGVGCYFGYGWISGVQDKANAKRQQAEKDSGGGQVGHIADLYNVLDATEPGHYRDPRDRGGHATGPRQRQSGSGQEIPLADDEDGKPLSPDKQLPIVPAVWTLDLAKAKIPNGRVNGMISGTNFVPETVRVDPVGTAQVLRLCQGQITAPDRDVLIYLHLKAGEKLGGQTLNISQDMKGAAVPQVIKRWKPSPRYALDSKTFTSGYVMKLELGQATNGAIAGRIFLALPDPEKSVVAGRFKISTNPFDFDAQVTPTATPAPNPAAAAVQAAFERRYGIKK
jgi:hypothetical protein